MRLIDADELLEHAWRDKLNSRELIAKMIDNAPTVKEIPTKIPLHIFEKMVSQDPCEDAISRQAVLDAIKDYATMLWKMYNEPFNERAIMDIVQDLPSVTPKPKTGHWEEYGNSWEDKFKCSECGKEQPKILCGERIIGHWSDYCPHCGCRMKGEGE